MFKILALEGIKSCVKLYMLESYFSPALVLKLKKMVSTKICLRLCTITLTFIVYLINKFEPYNAINKYAKN